MKRLTRPQTAPPREARDAEGGTTEPRRMRRLCKGSDHVHATLRAEADRKTRRVAQEAHSRERAALSEAIAVDEAWKQFQMEEERAAALNASLRAQATSRIEYLRDTLGLDGATQYSGANEMDIGERQELMEELYDLTEKVQDLDCLADEKGEGSLQEAAPPPPNPEQLRLLRGREARMRLRQERARSADHRAERRAASRNLPPARKDEDLELYSKVQAKLEQKEQAAARVHECRRRLRSRMGEIQADQEKTAAKLASLADGSAASERLGLVEQQQEELDRLDQVLEDLAATDALEAKLEEDFELTGEELRVKRGVEAFRTTKAYADQQLTTKLKRSFASAYATSAGRVPGSPSITDALRSTTSLASLGEFSLSRSAPVDSLDESGFQTQLADYDITSKVPNPSAMAAAIRESRRIYTVEGRERKASDVRRFTKQRLKRVTLTEGPCIRRMLLRKDLGTILREQKACPDLTPQQRLHASQTALRLHQESRIGDLVAAIRRERERLKSDIKGMESRTIGRVKGHRKEDSSNGGKGERRRPRTALERARSSYHSPQKQQPSTTPAGEGAEETDPGHQAKPSTIRLPVVASDGGAEHPTQSSPEEAPQPPDVQDLLDWIS